MTAEPAVKNVVGPRVLYLAYWGALEPLGQALLVPTVRELAARGLRIALVTFEKSADAHRPGAAAKLSRELGAAGVRWCPLRYHKRPRIPATAFDILDGTLRGAAAGFRADLVLGRTFIGGLVARLTARILGKPFVYHNEGFYPDEMVDGGFWRVGSPAHRIARQLEASLYRSADGVIVLSRRAADGLRAGALAGQDTPVVVVPSAIALERFVPRRHAPLRGRELRLVHLGGVGGRYRLDVAARLARAAAARHPTRLDVLTAAAELARRTLVGSGLPADQWSVRTLSPGAVPSELQTYDAGCAFLVEGLSEHAGSPTKVGEYWACGLPVVTTATVGDVGDIVECERVGLVLRGHTEGDYAEAAVRLLEMLEDPELPSRCRRAAETHYDLGAACGRQGDLFRQVLRGRS